MASPSFNEAELFGGAISVQVPTDFQDMSQIRPVPDHQEVFVKLDSIESIMFSILEYVDKSKAETDEDAVKYHLDDILDVEMPNEDNKIWSIAKSEAKKVA
jgi:hypothetical protein